MSKKGNLGRSLIKDRFSSKSRKKFVADKSMLHTTELHDGYDWGRLNLQSVTEESSFQEFLSTAELAGREFQAEKRSVRIATHSSKNIKTLLTEEREKARKDHEQYKERLQIPRRPPWTSEMSTQELDRNEKDHFLEWRRNLALLQEKISLTPYEKNLEFWRQLWRVVERSDVVIQIVDARNPLLFRCEDLEKYVKEVSEHKINLILINKADFLTENQRRLWADYFSSINVRSLFFSSVIAAETEKEPTIDEENLNKTNNNEETEDNHSTDSENLKTKVDELERNIENTSQKLTEILEKIGIRDEINSYKVLTREELIEVFSTVHKGPKVTENVTTIGLVGYPNVGKSSTINALLSEKKVSVSATPGKTKHFQTLFLDKNILLCDCPGLVMPFVSTKAEMIVNGILPIDQMRDHVPPVELVSCLIPRHVIEEKYGIMLPKPMEDEDPNRPPTAEELLNTYGFYRGFMTSNGQPDNPRAARYILKDFMNGKLLYCHAPPTALQELYHIWPEQQKSINKVIPPRALRASKTDRVSAEDFDKMYFQKKNAIHFKGVIGKSSGVPDSLRNGMDGQQQVKPWKKQHRQKKEKLRRVYAHLDEH
ncbi:hypothetical protein WA026_000799 [Henosepilachna vigintioctopunctata]|uniref:Large subunit GTPase 1 homolog n=1 Tax=Henosepilachna vigintioctopunctata TaxID=420089 RepID=A0AAW1V593_9CUCU